MALRFMPFPAVTTAATATAPPTAAFAAFTRFAFGTLRLFTRCACRRCACLYRRLLLTFGTRLPLLLSIAARLLMILAVTRWPWLTRLTRRTWFTTASALLLTLPIGA